MITCDELPDLLVREQVGDEVFWAGSLARFGSFAEEQLVDYRIVGHKPKRLSFTEAAAFPLVSLTAFEAIHEHMKAQAGKSLLVLPGAGGVGSIAIQLAKQAGLKVIGTASRAETRDFAKRMGADTVIDHSKGLEAEFKAHGLPPVEYVLNAVSEDQLLNVLKVLAPLGHVVGITWMAGHSPEVVQAMMMKRATLSIELMFVRSMSNVQPELQGEILQEISRRIDAGQLQPIHTQVFKGFEQIAAAQEIQQSGKAIGKIVIELV